MSKPILLSIEGEDQEYVDTPVYVEIIPKPLSVSIANLCGRRLPRLRDLDHYKRTPLQWMKPDGNGGLVPKNP